MILKEYFFHKMSSLKDIINIKIRYGNIPYFEYKNFSNIEKIGEGAFGIVNKADWNDGGIKVALKSSENVFKEVNNLQMVSL